MSPVMPAADGKNYVDIASFRQQALCKLYMEKSWFRQCLQYRCHFQGNHNQVTYVVSANNRYSCLSLYSDPFKVIDAKGPNAPNAVKGLLANALSNTQVQLGWSQAAQQANRTYCF
jgi:hypothetical protein